MARAAAAVAAAAAPVREEDDDDEPSRPPTSLPSSSPSVAADRRLGAVRVRGGGDRGPPPAASSSAASSSRRDAAASPPQKKTLGRILLDASKRGLGGGLPGFVAGVVQVVTLMWIRTVVNYQCRYGSTFLGAVRTLHREGGVRRFYRGVSFALVQAPLAKFVSTAANDGVEAFLESFEGTRGWGPGRSTAVAGVAVGIWRTAVMPVDTCKTVLQVDGVEGFRNLMRKVKAGRVGVLYQGAVAQAILAVVSYYPWFYTYNFLSKHPRVRLQIPTNLLRNAFVGFVASVASDVVSNVLRVVKTTKQASGSKRVVGYGETARMILAADGWKGLFGRGLKTRILGNAVQSVLFTVVWRGIAERWGSSGSSASGAGGDGGDAGGGGSLPAEKRGRGVVASSSAKRREDGDTGESRSE